MSDFMHHEGEPVMICGYAAPFNRLSVPHVNFGGRCGLIRSEAFDLLVAVRPLDLYLGAYHLERPGFANMWWRNLRVWTDPFGLAFEAGPVRQSPVNRHIVAAIVQNRMRGCSFEATVGESSIEEIDGEEVYVVRKFERVDHLTTVEHGAFEAACCWCSHENHDDMSPYLQQVVAHWHANRPAAKPRPALPSQPAARVAASRPTPSKAAKPQAPAKPMTDEEIFGTPPAGMSMEAWKWFGHMEAYGRRQMDQYDRAAQRRKT